MIEKVVAFKSSDGKTFEKIEDVQKHELRLLVANEKGEVSAELNKAIDTILEKKEKVLDILTTGPRSKPKARKINGGTRKRTTAATAPAVPN